MWEREVLGGSATLWEVGPREPGQDVGVVGGRGSSFTKGPSACPSTSSLTTDLLPTCPRPSESQAKKQSKQSYPERSAGLLEWQKQFTQSHPRLRPSCCILPEGQLWPETGWQADMQTVTREQGTPRHTADRSARRQSQLSLTLCDTGRCPTCSGPQFPHYAMRAEASMLSPRIMIWHPLACTQR